MIYLQIALLILISVTQVFRPEAIGDWERFRRSKVMLLVSFSVFVVSTLGSRPFNDGRFDLSDSRISTLQDQLTLALLILCAGFYLFSLKTSSRHDSRS
jgi:Ca2+/Na+ antiporter